MAMTKARRLEKDAQVQHYMNTTSSFSTLMDLAIGRRKWSGLPDTFDEWFMNKTLTVDNEIIWFEDPDIGPLCLPASSYGRIDVYGRPTGFFVWGFNGYHRFVPANEAIRVFNNESRISILPGLIRCAEVLTQMDSLLSTNIEVSKMPFLIQCSEEQQKTFEKLLYDVSKNNKYIWADKSMDAKDIRVLQTGVVLQTDPIISGWNKVFNREVMMLGYEHTNVDKKERLVAAEVSSNFGVVEAMRKSAINPSLRSIEEGKRKHLAFKRKGINKFEWVEGVGCEFDSDLPTMLNMPELQIEKEAPTIETV